MKYTKDETYADFGDFLATKFYAGEIEPTDWHHGDGYFFGLFGDRRVLIDGYGYGYDYERFDTPAEAYRRMEQLHEDRPPYEMDGIVSEDRGSYYVTLEGIAVGSFDDRDDAVRGLAQAMVDSGCFPDAFYVNDRGNSHRIDSEVRELHDEGGTRMRQTETAR